MLLYFRQRNVASEMNYSKRYFSFFSARELKSAKSAESTERIEGLLGGDEFINYILVY